MARAAGGARVYHCTTRACCSYMLRREAAFDSPRDLVALSLCITRTAHPLQPRLAKIVGAPISGTTTRPNPTVWLTTIYYSTVLRMYTVARPPGARGRKEV